jgi:hypothetical protein
MMFKRAAAVLLMLPSFAFAWGGEGHQVTALIAYRFMTPEAKAATKAMLGGANIYDGEVANWADRIRRTDPASAPWHYVDADVEETAIDLARDGNKGKNVVDGISHYTATLSDTAEPAQDREQALRWVVHLIGDAHQPLHCCDRNKDRGGNDVAVQFRDVKKPTNLHAIWDTAMLRTYIGSKNITDFADSLSDKIKPADVRTWSAGTPLDWANETHMVAVHDVYSDLPAGDPVKIDPKYIDAKQAVVEKQLERGGIRLATVLNRAFAAAPTTRPTK